MPEATSQPPSGKKKKKNAPDKPQPARLLPPDEENPVMNPKRKLNAEEKKEIENMLKSIESFKYKSVEAPRKPQPPSQLLQLVAAFLTSYGFNSTSDLFTIERKTRKRKLGWDDSIGEIKVSSKQPTLVNIYNDWLATALVKLEDTDTSSSSGEDDEDEKAADSSIESGDSESDSSGATAKANKKKPTATPSNKKQKITKKGSDSSSSSSDSDADDEEEALKPVKAEKGKAEPATQKSAASKVTQMISNPKKRAVPVATGHDPKAVNGKSANHTASSKGGAVRTSGQPTLSPLRSDKNNAVVIESGVPDSSSEESSEDAAGAAAPVVVTKTTTVIAKKPKAAATNGIPKKSNKQESDVTSESGSDSDSSDSSVVPVNGEAKQAATKSAAASAVKKPTTKKEAVEIAADESPLPKKRKHPSATETTETTESAENAKKLKKNHVPFQRVPSDTYVDPRFSSNKYQSYNYAERAYNDLSVTKGKGFTKEKNKKKRGSYRGGIIDVSGGKSIKFED